MLSLSLFLTMEIYQKYKLTISGFSKKKFFQFNSCHPVQVFTVTGLSYLVLYLLKFCHLFINIQSAIVSYIVNTTKRLYRTSTWTITIIMALHLDHLTIDHPIMGILVPHRHHISGHLPTGHHIIIIHRHLHISHHLLGTTAAVAASYCKYG